MEIQLDWRSSLLQEAGKKRRIFVYLGLWFLSTYFLLRSFLDSKRKWEFTLFSFFPVQCADGAHFHSLHQSLPPTHKLAYIHLASGKEKKVTH